MGEPTLVDLIKKIGASNDAAAKQEERVEAARAEEAEILAQIAEIDRQQLSVAALREQVQAKKNLLHTRQRQLIQLQRALAGALQRRAAQGVEVAQSKSTAQGALIICRAEALVIERALRGLIGEKQTVIDVFEMCEVLKKLYDAGVKVGVIQPSPSAEERQTALAEQQLKLLEKLQTRMAGLIAGERAELQAANAAAAAASAAAAEAAASGDADAPGSAAEPAGDGAEAAGTGKDVDFPTATSVSAAPVASGKDVDWPTGTGAPPA